MKKKSIVINALYYGLQPALLVAALAFWAWSPSAEVTLGVGILAVQVILGVLESLRPARPDWSIGVRDRGVQIIAFVVIAAVAAALGELYRGFMVGPLSELRTSWHLDIWPHEWPGLVQVFMVFFFGEFLWYWVHRAEHRWSFVWRASGHGAHHSFKKLGALNAGLNHPFELALLIMPAATIELVFGVGGAAAGAALLVATQGSIVHTNLALNSDGIGWLFTTNRYHIHHHSVVLDESNTNYGCAAIVWDRLFGTFADSPTVETGTGPTEPGMWRKAVMPFVEPPDTAVAPGGLGEGAIGL